MTEQPLGDDDATIQVTYLPRAEVDDDVYNPTALLTVRVKDQDLTADQLFEVAGACLRAAGAIRRDEFHEKGRGRDL